MNNKTAFPFDNHVLLLHKPTHITSSDAIQKIKRALGIKKIGHAGTLDKFAEGLLVVLIGQATKLSDILLNLDKEYKATLCFGIETDSLDPEGAVVANSALPTEEVIQSVVSSFTGELMQTPPQYSAIHIQGTRASTLARQGKDFDIPERPITVYTQRIVSFSLPEVEVEWRVSKGTYIRSLARDIGRACNSHAYLSALTRSKISNFSLEESTSLETLLSWQNDKTIDGIFSIEAILSRLSNCVRIDTDNKQIRAHLANGIQPISILVKANADINKVIYVCDPLGLVGIWKWNQNKWKQVLSA